MDIVHTGRASLKVDILKFLIEIFGCIFEQLVVLNRAVDGRKYGLTLNGIAAPIPNILLHHG